MKPYFGTSGNLESWKKIVNTYALPGYEGYAFAHLCGYGSLLMEMTQMRSGMISIQGNSGSGKSTVLMTINSIFIKPDSYMTKQDTQNAKFARIGIMNNICSTFDEVSNMEPQDVSDLAYSVTQGRGKDRLTASAALQANTSSWAQLLVCTTNHSLIHKLSNYKSDASAESFRIFEYSLNTQGHVLSKIEADDVFEQLNDHYGLAGEVFIQYMVNHYDEIKTRMRAWQRDFDIRMGMANNERYWSAMAACNMVGGYIAKELGLHDFNMETIENWLTETVTKMRGVVSDNVKDAKQVLSDFITSHVGSTLIIDKYENVVPRDKIFLRFDSDNSRLYIDKTYMRKYVTKNGGDWEAVTVQLAKDGVVVSDNHRIVMTKGTKLPAAGQTYTMVFDTEHPAMAGVRLEELKVKVG
jgi:energy-coupling factor transporter ATP-binding protein EcfA2